MMEDEFRQKSTYAKSQVMNSPISQQDIESGSVDRIDRAPKQRRAAIGLGGWLLLPIIGLFLDIASYIYVFVRYSAQSFTDGTLVVIFTGGSTGYDKLTTLQVIFTAFNPLVQSAFSLTLIILSFIKHKSVPKLFVAYYVIYFLIRSAGLVLVLLRMNLPDMTNIYTLIGFVVGASPAVIAPAIWIPYFLRSKRVAHTFGSIKKQVPAVLDAPALSGPFDAENPYAYIGTEKKNEE